MHFPASQVLNDEEEQQPDALKPRNEDIGHDRSGTPIKILPLHHVYSATSPCSGSTNVLSKKIKAQKFPMIDYVEEEDFKGKNQASHPPVIKVYSRRSKKHGKTSVFTVENLEEESKKRVKVEPVDDGSNALGDNVVGFQSKRKRIRSSEFAKLGARPNVVYNSVVGPRLRELRNHHNHTVEKHSNSRRPRKHGKTSVFNSMVENLEQGSKKRVKVEPVDEGPNAPCDNAVGFQGKRRRIGSSELVKLGVRPNVVHNSVVGPRLREPRNHHNHIVDKNSNSRRPKKHGKTSLCDSMVENLKEGLKKTVKVEPVDKGSNALGDNAVGFQSTRRRIGNSELVKLGVRPNVVHNSVVGPRLREPRKHHNHIVDKNSNSRRPKKQGKTSACDSMVENLEEGLKKRVKVELAAEGSNALGDNAVGFQCKRRRIGSTELVKLGVRPNVVHNSVVGPRLREPRNHHNHIVDKDSNSGKLKRVKPNSSINNKKQDQLRVKKWVRLAFDGMDPMLFIGLKCMVYWPLDDDWYEGSIVGYDAESNQHNVKYDDEEEEDLIISQEKIKFYVSRDEMLKLNLCQSNSGMECDDLDCSELLVLAASLDGSRELEPGDIIWAKVTGHAMWPAVIVDELHVGDRKGLNKNSGGRSLPVQFFGTHDFARIQVKQIVSFSRGLVSSFHLKSKSLRFIRSLREAKIYLNEQKLPKSMLHLQCGSTGASQENHSDEDGQSIDSDDACTRDGRMHQDSIDLRTSTLTIGDLQIVSLGEIVKDSDYFQDGRTVWPAGYTAIRMFTSIRDPSASVAYKMEVLRDSKSKIRPLFRVTMESGEQFKGPSPEACWEKLFKRLRKIQIDCLTPEDGAEITHVSGSEMFGFTNPEVLKLIQDLSNSGVSRKSSVRKSLSKRRQSMPDSYRAVNINWKDLDRCSVCHMDEEYETNLFLQCDECRMMVHARCYGEESVDGLLWLCKICRIGSPKSIPPCSLCPVVGGAMKPTTDGQWAHLACAMWIPETCLSDIKRMEPIDGLSRISKDRWKLLCSICGVSYGACIQCSNSTCRVAYHPLCARAAGLCVELEDEDRLHLMPVDDDEEEQCIRLLSFCKRHKPPSREHANLHVRRRQNACQPSSYIPPSNPSGCARTEPYDYFGRRGRKEPDALAAASVKRSFLENRPYVVGGYCRHERLVHISSEDDVLMGSKFSFMLQENRSSAPHSPQCASMADKYKYMRETFRHRLTFGKSRIHGFGIFAKQFHRAGDMVIEYTGELVRPSVADRREHLIYNSLVGPGTYMFRVDDERVIDATREGSIAHLINHSCEPNCYSRVITVNGDQHIIIFAKRDIKQWEELTYDYRFFSIDECLPCYCGFPRCRGVVNDTEAEEQAKLYVPSCQLRQDE